MNVIWQGSPNFSSRKKGLRPTAVILHVMAGSLSGTDAWFGEAASQVSAHYGIGSKGEIHQYVEEKYKAWHAGNVASPTVPLPVNLGGKVINPNEWTIGIEHEGSGVEEFPLSLYISSARLLRTICLRWTIPLDAKHVLLHREIYAVKTCPGMLDRELILRLANLSDLS